MTLTLAPFEWLLEAREHTIRCPTMYLDGWHDHDPPVYEGSGRLILDSSVAIRFEMDATASDLGRGMEALRRCAEEAGDRTSAMRLRGVDYQGREWNAGWVRPRLGEVQGGHHHLHGNSLSIVTDARHDEGVGGVELAYSPSPDVPFTEVITNTARVGDAELGWRTQGGRHRMELLGAEITASTQPWRDELWICARASDELNHPYLENWLSEPLRALRGQLIYPRLVARKFADGRAAIWVRTAPALSRSLGGCASQLKKRSAAEFWSFYAAYLTYVAKHRGADGHPGFEANDLTRLHDEVIQARMSGSSWVIALCVASAIEGLIKLDPAFASAPADFTDSDLDPLKSFASGISPEPLAARLKGWVATLHQPSPARYLSRLEKDGRISRVQLDAWRKVRNVVAHGNLFEPWGTPEEHAQLVALIELFYRLTALRIGYES
jgi:hypothetical protein